MLGMRLKTTDTAKNKMDRVPVLKELAFWCGGPKSSRKQEVNKVLLENMKCCEEKRSRVVGQVGGDRLG